MKNRILLTAAALAAMSAHVAASAKSFAARVMPPLIGNETGTSNPRPPRYNRRSGISVSQGKRLARRRRNVLRARGHHRQAVR